jgi:hypothetical protein
VVRKSNWGPPLSYAANLGRDRIIRMLRELGATDLEHAIDRAVLQGRIGTIPGKKVRPPLRVARLENTPGLRVAAV